MAPVKTFQSNTKYCPWLSAKTKLLIKERNEAQKQLSGNRSDDNISKFKRLRNEVTKNLRSDKVEWQKLKLEKSNNDAWLVKLVRFWITY